MFIKKYVIGNIINRCLPALLRYWLKRLIYGAPPICHDIKILVKNTKLADIIKLHDKARTCARVSPVAFNGCLPKVFIKNQTYFVHERALYRIPRVKISGGRDAGLLMLPNGSVSSQTGWCLDHIINSSYYYKKSSIPIYQKKGNFYSLILYWGLEYYHWFNDVLSMLFENLEYLPKDTIFIVPEGMRSYNIDALNLLGIGPEKRIVFSGSEIWELENLWFQPPAVDTVNHTPGALQWLGHTLSKALPIDNSEIPVRIFISRSKAAMRSIANESEIIPVLKEYGFLIIAAEELSLTQQIRLFRNAIAVVAPHGAGCTNLIFSSKGTRFLEIFEPSVIRPCYWSLCYEFGHSYRFMFGKPFYGRGPEPDIIVDKNKLRSELELLISDKI